MVEVQGGELRRFKVTPEEAGLERRTGLTGLEGGTPADNAATIRKVLEGEQGPARDIVVLNAAATLVVAGLADVLADAADLARASIDEGKAAGVLDRLVAATTEAVL